MTFGMRRPVAKILMLSLSGSALAFSSAAFAQATPAEEGPDDDSSIIVTARLVEERLIDVPVSVSALTSDDLVRQQIDDLGDVAEKTVGFAFESFTGPLAQPSVRGQTNLRVTSPVQNVSTTLNGLYLQRGYFVDQSLLDLERVEIIKGPQSALYGRNAFAGVVSLVTRQPDLDDFSGRVTGTIGTDERYEVRGGVNVPIIPGRLAIYAAAGHSQFDGTWKNNHPLANDGQATTKGNLGGYNKEAYQVSITAKPVEALTLEGTYIRTEREQESNPSYTLTTAGLTSSSNSLNASPTGVGAARQNRLYVGEIPARVVLQPGETRAAGLVVDPRTFGLRGPTEIITGKATLAPGGPFTLEYRFGRTKADIDTRGNQARDASAPTIIDFDGPGPAPATNFGVVFDSSGADSSFKSTNHELRASFDFGSVRGFIGAEYTRTRDIDSNLSEFAPVNSFTAPDPRSRFAVAPGAPIPTTVVFRRNTFLLRSEDVLSGFGFLEWKPSEQIAITLEGRYTQEDQKAADLIASDPAPNTGRVALVTPRTKRSDNFFAPRASISFRPTPDVNLYASVAKGIKSGGINGVAAEYRREVVTGQIPFTCNGGTVVATAAVTRGTPPAPAVIPPGGCQRFIQLTPGTAGFSFVQETYEPETNWTYEIGAKTQMMGGRLRLNVAAYYTDWKNVQSNAVRLLPDGTPPTSFIAIVPSVTGNVGDVKVYGAEIEGSFRFVDSLTLNFGAAYNHSRYKKGVFSQRFGASGNCDGIVCAYTTAPGLTFPVLDIGGNQLERVPEFDALVGLQFDTTFANDWEFFARADATYQTKQYVDEANLAWVPSRTLVNASTGVTVGGFAVQLWVKNLFNKKYVSNSLFLVGTGGAGSASYVPILGEKRTAGLTASFKF